MSLIISTQGELASFHHEACKLFFGDNISIISCKNFPDTIKELSTSRSDRAVIAIENSLYGSINEVYDLLLAEDITICGEVYLHIEQCLIGMATSDISKITEVHSHPVALAQCSSFLDEYLPNAERFEHYDTAGSVADVKAWRSPNKSAIAGAEAAKLHGMRIIKAGIETNKQNYTRFVVVRQKTTDLPNDANKTSLILKTPTDQKAGSLYRALGVFANKNINLLTLHSRPIIGKAWHYMFYIDIELSPESPDFKAVVDELNEQGCELTILGSYKNGMI